MQKIGPAVFFLEWKKIYTKILNFLAGDFSVNTDSTATIFLQPISLVWKYAHAKFQTIRLENIDFITKS